jgi:hypothetical protein
LKEMATVRKGNGTTVRRRTKSAAKQAATTIQQSNGKPQESNGKPAHNGAVEAAPNSEINIETIRVRAYDLFLARGAIHGDDLADWLIAERELCGAQKP